jgi:pilus assembly protein CpaE
MLRIAIVDPSDSTREPLRSLLLGVDFVWLEAECARYEFFYDVIQQSMPDLVVVNLDSDRNRSANLVQQLAAEYGRLPILAISSDHQSLLDALKRGAKYFLTQPVVLEELLSVLRRVQGETGAADTTGHRPTAQSSTVIAVLGSRGGVGCTSLAVNLGATLAHDPANNAALLDLDLALGDADVALEVTADQTIADLAYNIERLDMNFIKRSLVKHEGSGLSVLCHPLQIQEVGVIHEAHLERIINLLKISYSHLVLDLSKSLSPIDLTALRIADVILLVAQLELSSLRNVVRLLNTLSLEAGLGDKVRVVVNRVGSEPSESDISLQKAEETIGKPIFWQVPNDHKAVAGARVTGVPLVQYAPRCRAQQSIYGLAQWLCGKGGVPASESPRSGGLFGRLRGR